MWSEGAGKEGAARLEGTPEHTDPTRVWREGAGETPEQDDAEAVRRESNVCRDAGSDRTLGDRRRETAAGVRGALRAATREDAGPTGHAATVDREEDPQEEPAAVRRDREEGEGSGVEDTRGSSPSQPVRFRSRGLPHPVTGHLSSFVTAVTSVRGTHGTVVFPLSLHNESWAVNNHPGHSGPAPFRGKSKSAQRFIRLIPDNNTAAVNFSRSLQKEAANPRMLVQCFFTKIREGRFSPLNKRFVSVMEHAEQF